MTISCQDFGNKNKSVAVAADGTTVAKVTRKVRLVSIGTNSFRRDGYTYRATLNSGAKLGPVDSIDALLLRIRQAI